MSQKRSLSTLLLMTSLGMAAAFGVVSPVQEAQAGGKTVDCKSFKSKYTEAKKACDAVGGDRAKLRKTMKTAQKAYNAASGNKVKCTTCHEKGNGDGELKTGGTDEHWAGFKTHLK